MIFNLEAQTNFNTDKMAFGFTVNQFQEDFGLGVHLVSPYFVKSSIAIRGGINFQWLENFNGTETSWTSYKNIQLGIRSRTSIISDKIFVYGEGGFIIILPNSDFSSEDMEIGGYGLFGFEFILNNHFAYFLEFGGVGTGARADKIIGIPIYSNGFLASVGYRIRL